MSVGLHPRLIGHPARIKGLEQFLDCLVGLKNQVWVCQRLDVAEHWLQHHPHPATPATPKKTATVAAAAPTPDKGSRSAVDNRGRDNRLLVTGGAGFVLSNLVHHWLDSDPGATAVIFDQKRAWDSTVQRFLGPFVESERLALFDGSVTDKGDWDRLTARHGGFSHVVSAAAITPSLDEEKANPDAILEVNLMGTVHCLQARPFACTVCPAAPPLFPSKHERKWGKGLFFLAVVRVMWTRPALSTGERAPSVPLPHPHPHPHTLISRAHDACLEPTERTQWARANNPNLNRFLHVSSDAVLGVPGLVSPLPTGTVRDPTTVKQVPQMHHYATSKVAGEAGVARWKEL